MAGYLGKSLAQIDALSVREITEWAIYEQIEPFGDRRGDVQAAMVAATVANAMRRADQKQYPLAHFIPKWEPVKAAVTQTPEQQLAIWTAIQQIHNAKLTPETTN